MICGKSFLQNQSLSAQSVAESLEKSLVSLELALKALVFIEPIPETQAPDQVHPPRLNPLTNPSAGACLLEVFGRLNQPGPPTRRQCLQKPSVPFQIAAAVFY